MRRFWCGEFFFFNEIIFCFSVCSFSMKTSIIENCFTTTETHNEITDIILKVPVIALFFSVCIYVLYPSQLGKID